jgi:hypothetical protein
MEVVLLVGNHDQASTTKDDHAMASMARVAGVRVIETTNVVECETADVVCVPFIPGPASSWLADEVAKGCEGCSNKWRILAIHLGIEDKNTPPFLRNADDSIKIDALRKICDAHSIDAVYAGNWHDRKEYDFGKSGVRILQCGALVPTGWDNPGMDGYGTVAHFGDLTGVTFDELSGPRFVREPFIGATECKVYVDELPDRSVIRAAKDAAHTAARRASSAETLDEALSNYVEAMQIPEDVDRAEVLAQAKGFLR